MREDGEQLRVLCDPSDLSAVREALEAAGVEIESAAIATEPKSTVEVKGHDAERLLKLLDALDDQDDVDEVFANFDIPEDVLGEARGLDGDRSRLRGKASDRFPESLPCK